MKPTTDTLRRGIAPLLLLPALAAPAAAQCCDQLASARSWLSGAAAGGTVLFAGGYDPMGAPNGQSDAVDLYDTATGTWSTAQLSVGRWGMGSTGLGALALFGGGGFSSPTFQIVLQDRVDIYDASTGAWSTASLSVPRIDLAATSVGSTALFAGGYDTGVPPQGVSARVDLYDASTGLWSTASLSQPRANLAATSVGGVALFAGGSAASLASDVVDLYDAATGTWSTAALSAPRYWLAATSAGPYALFAGGQDQTLAPSDVVDVYDSTTGQWSTATLSEPRSLLTAVSVDGRAFFAGGSTAPNLPSARVDVFDSATGTWSSFELCDARHTLAAAAAGGQALFAGGRSWRGTGGVESATVDRLPAGFPRAYCFGDGSAAACPCGNPGAAGGGCANSTGAGARLTGAGCTSAAADGLALLGADLVAGQPVLAFAGLNATAGGAGLLFGDGLRCAGGGVVRLGTQSVAPDGSSSWGPGLGALGGWGAGDLRRFQLWYRDPLGPCSSSFNLTNGVEVTFAP